MNCYLYSNFKVIWVFTPHGSGFINPECETNDFNSEVAVEDELNLPIILIFFYLIVTAILLNNAMCLCHLHQISFIHTGPIFIWIFRIRTVWRPEVLSTSPHCNLCYKNKTWHLSNIICQVFSFHLSIVNRYLQTVWIKRQINGINVLPLF